MQSKKATSLLVVLGMPKASKWREYTADFYPVDHILHLLPSDLSQQDGWQYAPFTERESYSNFGLFLDKINHAQGIDQVSVIAEKGISAQLESFLESLRPFLANECWLSVAGFRVSASSFSTMVETFECITLYDCRLLNGWWKPRTQSAKCSNINVKICSGAVPKRSHLGQSAWPSLRSILIWESSSISGLSPQDQLSIAVEETREGSSDLTKAIVTCLWSPAIADIHITGSYNLDWLTEIPSSKSLTDIWLNGSVVSVNVFRWLLKNRSLRSVALSWLPDVRLPWSELRQLKRIKQLRFDDTHLNDEQLIEIAQVTKPLEVVAYYTSLTSRSWRTILSWPGLRSFWGSDGLVEGDLPQDLPPTTDLRECVAVNANSDQYRLITDRYEGLEIIEM